MAGYLAGIRVSSSRWQSLLASWQLCGLVFGPETVPGVYPGGALFSITLYLLRRNIAHRHKNRRVLHTVKGRSRQKGFRGWLVREPF